METGGPSNPAPPPAPDTSMGGATQDERTHAMLSWILMIVIGFISPLIFLLIDKDKPFVYRHAAQGLSLCITLIPVSIAMFILAIVLAFLGPLVILMVPLWLAVFVGVLAAVIMGAVNANKGMDFAPPISSAICKALFKV